MTSTESILALQCWSHGVLPDHLIMDHASCRTEGERLSHMHHVMNEVVPSTTMQQFVLKSYSYSLGPYFAFRSSYASHLAVQSVLTYLFRIQDRNPQNHRLYLKSGQLTSTVLKLGYDDNLLIDGSRDAVPFRLTTNNITTVGPTGLEGTYVGAALSAARVWSEKRIKLLQILDTFIRDDLSLWIGLVSPRRLGPTSEVIPDTTVTIDPSIEIPPCPPGVRTTPSALCIMRHEQLNWRCGLWNEILRGDVLESCVKANLKLVESKLDSIAPLPQPLADKVWYR